MKILTLIFKIEYIKRSESSSLLNGYKHMISMPLHTMLTMSSPNKAIKRGGIMKKFIRYICVIIVGSSVHQTLTNVAQLSTKKEFIKTYMVNQELAQILDQHSKELAKLVEKIHASPLQKHGVWVFDWLPGYYVKYNVSRVSKQKALAQCITQENLDLMHTPEKLLYHIKGRSKKLHHLNYVVIIKEVDDDPTAYNSPINLKQVEQFITLIIKTGHISTHASNYLRLSDGRLSFIDTDGTFDKNRAIIGLIRLLRCDLETYYTPEALYYILYTIAQKLVLLYGQKKANAYRLLRTLLDRQKPEVAEHIKTVLEFFITQVEE